MIREKKTKAWPCFNPRPIYLAFLVFFVLFTVLIVQNFYEGKIQQMWPSAVSSFSAAKKHLHFLGLDVNENNKIENLKETGYTNKNKTSFDDIDVTSSGGESSKHIEKNQKNDSTPDDVLESQSKNKILLNGNVTNFSTTNNENTTPLTNTTAEGAVNTTENDICTRVLRSSQHLSPLATITSRIMQASPPLTPEQISQLYNRGCGLVADRTPDGQPTWREGAIKYIPTAGLKTSSVAKVYKADYEPHIPYNHTEFFEGRRHDKVKDKDRKVLLAHLAGWDPVNTPRPLRACPDFPCVVTTDSKKYQQTAAAITFNGETINTKAPTRPHPDQVYIMYLYEPLTPSRLSKHFKKQSNGWKSAFNWTMTYHLTSDILSTYGMVRLRPPVPLNKNYSQIVAKKTKKIAWFVSHCGTMSRREKYVAELKKYMQVDVYGRCGPLKCNKKEDTTCFDNVGRDYKFYLAFENALCEDYTSEKFFRTFKSDTVMVARGNAYLYRHVPADTFINAADFKSARELAQHLLYLDSHPEEYAALLRRKDQFFASYQDYPHYAGGQFWVKYTWEHTALCEVCQRVWNLEKYSKVYTDIFSWLDQRMCKPPTDLS